MIHKYLKRLDCEYKNLDYMNATTQEKNNHLYFLLEIKSIVARNQLN